jgi:serine/threonine-protein kinase ATR
MQTELGQHVEQKSTKMNIARKRYKQIRSNFPPIFHKWFLQHFSNPTHWFEARLAFGRSAALWSMVGHIVGLGDRHGENILIDTLSGDCVHVDFDCLFDKVNPFAFQALL